MVRVHLVREDRVCSQRETCKNLNLTLHDDLARTGKNGAFNVGGVFVAASTGRFRVRGNSAELARATFVWVDVVTRQRESSDYESCLITSLFRG